VKARSDFVFDRQRIVVAGRDSEAVAFAIATLRRDGHCVSHIAESLPVAWDLALRECHLLITASSIRGIGWTDLDDELRGRRNKPALLCITDGSWTPPARTPQSRPVATLREPFTAEELRAAVRPLLPQLLVGSILARRAESVAPTVSQKTSRPIGSRPSATGPS